MMKKQGGGLKLLSRKFLQRVNILANQGLLNLSVQYLAPKGSHADVVTVVVGLKFNGDNILFFE